MEKSLKIIAVGEERTAKDGRKYYSLTVQDVANAFAPAKSRNMWQQFNSQGEPVWKIPTQAEATKMIGRVIPGEIVSALVEEYEITNETTGETRKVNTYSTFVFGHETKEQVFKAFNHPIVGTEKPKTVAVLAPNEAFEAAAPNPAVIN